MLAIVSLCLFVCMLCKLVCYNVQGANLDRLEEIQNEFSSHHVLALQSIGNKAGRECCDQSSTAGHWTFKWGYRATSGSIKSCGVATLVSKFFSYRLIQCCLFPTEKTRREGWGCEVQV